MPNEHLSANLVLQNGFIKNCLESTLGECKQTNRHTVVGAEKHPLRFAQLPTFEGTLPNANESIQRCSFAFAIPSTYTHFR